MNEKIRHNILKRLINILNGNAKRISTKELCYISKTLNIKLSDLIIDNKKSSITTFYFYDSIFLTKNNLAYLLFQLHILFLSLHLYHQVSLHLQYLLQMPLYIG